LGRRHAARGARSGGTGPFWGCCRRRWAGRATLRSCTWRGMASPSRASGCLSAPGSRRTDGKATPAMLVMWLWPNRPPRGWKSEARRPKSEGNPKAEARSGLGRDGWRKRDAQGSNTVYAPEYHRRNTVEARERNAECGARNAECGLAVRPGAAGADIGVSFGTAHNGRRARVRPGLSF